jgi:hypothetical protein
MESVWSRVEALTERVPALGVRTRSEWLLESPFDLTVTGAPPVLWSVVGPTPWNVAVAPSEETVRGPVE